MTIEQTARLADIRTKLLVFSSEIDTSSWEATFFLQLLEDKNKEIATLRIKLAETR